jgi:photoactive yellow protein
MASRHAKAEKATEDLASALCRVLAADVVHRALTVDILVDADQDERERILARAEGIRADLIAQTDEIPVLAELQWTLAMSYLELKAEWIQRQVRVCYQQMVTGVCDLEVALEASMISYLLALIEPLLTADHLERLQTLFASEVRSDPFVDTAWAAATGAAAEGASFASAAELAALRGFSPAQLDDLPYGVVRLDDRGAVQGCNRYEREFRGATSAAAIGRNYFTEVAPCTGNQVFRGCFARAVEAGTADCLFSYTFSYRMKPTAVKVHLHREADTNWVLIAKV